MILAIETATRICSVALFNENKLIGLLESDEQNAHSRILHILIDDLLKNAGTDLSAVKAIAVSKGPGSYTGLRIGVSAAKGLCYAKNIPLIAINTLESMAFGMKQQAQADGLTVPDGPLCLIPMIDARRMEVFMAIYDRNLQTIKETAAEIITGESLNDWGLGRSKFSSASESGSQDQSENIPESSSQGQNDNIRESGSQGPDKSCQIILGGDGAAKCKDILMTTDLAGSLTFLESFEASAQYMLEPACKAFAEKQFENTAYFEPFYLKDFIAGKPRVKGLE